MKFLTKFFYENIMIMGTLFFSGAFIAGKFSVREFPVLPLTFLRFLIAGTVLFTILIFQKRDIKLPKKEIPIVLFLSLLGMVMYHTMFFTALKYTTSSNTALINTINPVLTSVIAGVFFKETFNKKTMFGVVLSFVGVIYLITNGSLEVLRNFSFNKGDLIMIVGVLAYATYFIMLKKVLLRINPYILTAYIFIFCAVILFPFVALTPMGYLKDITISGWGSLIYMAIFASIGGYLTQQISVKRVGLIKTSLYINITPVFSMILAYFILGEVITLEKIQAIIIIITGVVITIKSKNIQPEILKVKA